MVCGAWASATLVGETVPPVLVNQTIRNRLTFHLAKFPPDPPSPYSTRTPLLKLVLRELAMTEVGR